MTPASTLRRLLASIAVLGLLAALVPSIGGAPPAAAVDDVVLFDDAPAEGFADYSWGAADLEATNPVAGGSRSMSADLGPWEALYLSHEAGGVAVPRFGELTFSVHGGANADAVLAVQLVAPGGAASPPVEIRPAPGAWTDVAIDLADFGSLGRLEGIWWQEYNGAAISTIAVDEVRIVAGEAPPAENGPTLTVGRSGELARTITDPATGVATTQITAFPHAISDEIYGMNFAPDSLREEFELALNRWGGNSTERFNHETSTSNAGADWYYTNTDEAQAADDVFESMNAEDGTASLVTIPATGWVSRGLGGFCSYPVGDQLGAGTGVGPQDDSIPHWLDPSVECGNGNVGGEFLGATDPTLTSRPAGPTWAAAMVESFVAEHGTAAEGGVELYAVGNEPNLWYSTHGDIWPAPITRDDIIERNTTYAAAIKDVDPTAEVVGPVLWSGYSYWATAAEVLAGQRPGDVANFTTDYLQAVAAAEVAEGRRLIDRYAVNFYDERVFGGGSDAVRLESTRHLWDPTYVPEGYWVTRDFTGGEGQAVIPRLQGQIDRNYPGTGLAITEYNFGGEQTIAGALAQVDALGIFGREGLDSANIWDPFLSWVGLTEEEYSARPLMQAFRLYRNYDGSGGRFGDTARLATSTDETSVSVYAADRADGATTVMIVNKEVTDQVTPIDIVGASGAAEMYRYDGSDPSAIQQLADLSIDGETMLTLPGRSATLLVIEPSDGEPTAPVPAAAYGAVVIDAPGSMVAGGELASDTSSFVWVESGPVELAADLELTQVGRGYHGGVDIESGVVPAGSTVCSYRVHGDRVDGTGMLTGVVSFGDGRVLGVIHRPEALVASQALAAPGTVDRPAALEADDLLVLGPAGVGWIMQPALSTDGFRVITDCGAG